MAEQTIIQLSDARIIAARLRGQQFVARTSVSLPEPLLGCTEFSINALSAAIEPLSEQLPAGRVTLVIPAKWCYLHQIPLPAGRLNPQAAAFALEDFLPVALEEVTCAFQVSGAGIALGIAVPTRPLTVIVDLLGEHDWQVQRVLPDVFCALAAHPDTDDRGAHGLMLRDTQHRTAVWLDATGTPRLIQSLFANSGSTLLEPFDTAAEQLIAAPSTCWKLVDITDDPDQCILRGAAALRSPDLCSGGLRRDTAQDYQRSVRRLGGCAAILALVVLVCLQVQARRYQEAVGQIQAQQRTLFKRVFPQLAPPANPALVLASERKRHEGITLQHAETQGAAAPKRDPLRPLVILREIADRLPADVRIDMATLTVDSEQLLLRGTTRDHRDAERIADAIGTVDPIQVGAPRTSRLPSGAVDFSMRASLGSSAAGGAQ